MSIRASIPIALSATLACGCGAAPDTAPQENPLDAASAPAPDGYGIDDAVPIAVPDAAGVDAMDGATDADDGWKLVWAEEFDGTALDTGVFNIDDKPVTKNAELEYYSPNNVILENGALVLEAREESYGGKAYTSGEITTRGKKTFLYGRFVARMKLPALVGMWPAFWMLGVSGAWPSNGELDIMEARGRVPTEVLGTAHWGPNAAGHQQFGSTYKLPAGSDFTSWHEYELEWTPQSIRWSVDGLSAYQSLATSPPFDQPFYIILNLAVGGLFDGNVSPPSGMTPQRMYVDYVRVYQQT